MWSKGNIPPLLMGVETCTTTLELNLVVSKKIWIGSTSRPAILLLGIYTIVAQLCHRDTWSTMFIAALFIIARNWKQPRCFSTEKWIKKIWHCISQSFYSCTTIMTKKQLGRKGFVQLTHLCCCSSPKEVRTGTQTGQEAGADAEAMEGCYLLACFSWLAQLAFL